MSQIMLVENSNIEDIAQLLVWISQNYHSLQCEGVSFSHLENQKLLPLKSLDIKKSEVGFLENFVDYPIYLQTSGSSGIPKVIKKTFSQMCLEGKYLARFIQEKLDIRGIGHILCAVQAQHLFGLSFGVFMPLFLENRARVETIEPYIEHIMAYASEILIASPTLLRAISQTKEVSDRFRNLRLIISAGSPLDDDVRMKLDTKAKILDIYGSSETGVIGFNLGMGIKRFDEVALSYAQDSQLEVSSPWCPKVHISDIVELDGDNIVLLGRSDDIVKINDKRFSLYEIQQQVKKNSLIKDCIAYSKNNRLGLLLALSDEGIEHFRTFGKQGIVQEIKSKLELQNKTYLRYFRIVGEIPRNHQGKISKQQQEELINSREKIVLSEISKSPNQAIYEGRISEGCFYFDGHFVDFPLVPGFIELDLAIEYAKELGVNFLNIKKILNVKFTSFLRPRDLCRLELERKDDSLMIKMFANDQRCLSGRILLDVSGE